MSVGPVIALGEELRIQAFALAAVELVVAESPDQVRAAWRRLAGDVAVVLLTPMAASALAGELERPRLLWAELPS